MLDSRVPGWRIKYQLRTFGDALLEFLRSTFLVSYVVFVVVFVYLKLFICLQNEDTESQTEHETQNDNKDETFEAEGETK